MEQRLNWTTRQNEHLSFGRKYKSPPFISPLGNRKLNEEKPEVNPFIFARFGRLLEPHQKYSII